MPAGISVPEETPEYTTPPKVPTGIGTTVIVLMTTTGVAEEANAFSRNSPPDDDVGATVAVVSQASMVIVRLWYRATAGSERKRRANKAVGNEVHILVYGVKTCF